MRCRIQNITTWHSYLFKTVNRIHLQLIAVIASTKKDPTAGIGCVGTYKSGITFHYLPVISQRILVQFKFCPLDNRDRAFAVAMGGSFLQIEGPLLTTGPSITGHNPYFLAVRGFDRVFTLQGRIIFKRLLLAFFQVEGNGILDPSISRIRDAFDSQPRMVLLLFRIIDTFGRNINTQQQLIAVALINVNCVCIQVYLCREIVRQGQALLIPIGRQHLGFGFVDLNGIGRLISLGRFLLSRILSQDSALIEQNVYDSHVALVAANRATASTQRNAVGQDILVGRVLIIRIIRVVFRVVGFGGNPGRVGDGDGGFAIWLNSRPCQRVFLGIDRRLCGLLTHLGGAFHIFQPFRQGVGHSQGSKLRHVLAIRIDGDGPINTFFGRAVFEGLIIDRATALVDQVVEGLIGVIFFRLVFVA